MSIPMFPDRTRSRRRAPVVDVDVVRRYTAAALLGVAAVVTALVLAGLVPAAWLLVAVWALILAPLTRWGFGLLETVAPLPDVHTPVTGAALLTEVSTARMSLPDHELALAGAVGVYRVGVHSLRALAESDAPTTAIPQVQA